MIKWVDTELWRWADYHRLNAESVGWPAESYMYKLIHAAGHVPNSNQPESGGTTQSEAAKYEKVLTIYRLIAIVPEQWQAAIAAWYLVSPRPTYSELAKKINLTSKTAAVNLIHDIHTVMALKIRPVITPRDLTKALELEYKHFHKAPDKANA